jgi:Resolvase, N terminal domain
MTRVALYARYSSDNQRDASIEDQLRICREKAERETWTVVSTYKDAGISGASMILRPGIQTLLQDAQRQQFDIVLAEALDRISRDQADVATLFKHLRFAGVPIITLAEGEISELHVGLKGTMNALFLKDLAAKTHRGATSTRPLAPYSITPASRSPYAGRRATRARRGPCSCCHRMHSRSSAPPTMSMPRWDDSGASCFTPVAASARRSR